MKCKFSTDRVDGEGVGQMSDIVVAGDLDRTFFSRVVGVEFLFAVNLIMTSDQREALRQDAIRWIQSGEFDRFLKTLHLNPREMPLALLATVFHAEGLWPWDVISRTSQLGLATPLMRRRYRSLAQTGKVVIGYICEAAFQPASGRENYNPAHVMAGIGGTTDDEELVEACLKWQHELGLIAPALKKECPPNFAGSPGRVFCGGKSEDRLQ